MLRNRLKDASSTLRTQGVAPTVATLKAAMATASEPAAPAPGLVELLDEYLGVLVARGFRANTVKGYQTTRNALAE